MNAGEPSRGAAVPPSGPDRPRPTEGRLPHVNPIRAVLCAALVLVTAACGGSGDAQPAEAKKPSAGRRIDEAIDGPLRWLKDNQRADGSWSAEDAPAGSLSDDVSATSAALLTFLDRGYTNRSEGPFGRAVGNALRWLKGVQDGDGRFLPRDRPGSSRHDALATAALVEAYNMTGSVIHRGPAQRAIAALVEANMAAGPDAVVAPAPNLHAFAWAICALAAAQAISRVEVTQGKEPTFAVEDRVLEPARAWLDSARTTATSDPETVAARIAVRCAIGRGPEELAALRRDVLALSAHVAPTESESEADLSGYVASIAQAGSRPAGIECVRAWLPRGEAWIRTARRRDDETGERRGSYDERGPLATRTGRVEATANGARVEPPCCTAYLPRFPGTEPDPEPDVGPAPAETAGEAEAPAR